MAPVDKLLLSFYATADPPGAVTRTCNFQRHLLALPAVPAQASQGGLSSNFQGSFYGVLG